MFLGFTDSVVHCPTSESGADPSVGEETSGGQSCSRRDFGSGGGVPEANGTRRDKDVWAASGSGQTRVGVEGEPFGISV